MRIRYLWNSLFKLIYLLEVASSFAPGIRAQTSTGTITQQVTVNLTGHAGSANGTIDPLGTVIAAAGSTVATFTILAGPIPILIGESLQVQVPLTDDCSVTGKIIGGTGALTNVSGTLSLTGSPCLLTPDVTSFQISGTGTIFVNFTVDASCQGNSGTPAQPVCDTQALSIEPPIVGTPFELFYRSERVPGRSGTSAFVANYAYDLGGWTLDVRHAYDPVSGNLYLGSGNRRRAAVLGAPPVMNGNYLVTSEDGRDVYVFDNTGQHLLTRDALTGAVVYQFAYDANRRLKTVTDSAGNTTTFQRDAAGNLAAIVGPYGQKTTFTLNSDGYITQITNPNQESMKLTYGAGGLVTSMTDALGNTDRFQYDSNGLLTHADHASGASEDLAVNSSDGRIQLTTAAGVSTNYATDLSTPGTEAQTVTYATGLQDSTQSSPTSFSASPPDGTMVQTTFAPDPRWGIQAPTIAGSSITTPGGNQFSGTETRAIILNSPNDPFSLSSLTDTVAINGRATTRIYSGATRTLFTTSPAARTGSTTFDASGRVISQKVGGLDPTSLAYDSHGRLSSAIVGSGSTSQTTSLAYNNQGYLASMTDSLGRTSGFEYDGAGRIMKQNLPQGTSIVFSYDANGQLTSLTPPSRSAHTMTYAAPGRLAKYSPPAVNGVNSDNSFTYDADGRITHAVRGSQAIDVSYDNAGRPTTISLPTGTKGYVYDAQTGNLAAISAPDDVGLSFNYDGSLLTQQTWAGPVSGTVANTYDSNFFLIGRSINDSTINYQYDPDGLLIQAGMLSISRDPSGLPTGTAIDSITDTFGYDSLGQESSYAASVNGSPMYSVQLTRDAGGRLTGKTETIQGVATSYSYTYDSAGQLSTVANNGSVTSSYSYDANGNRVSYTGTNTVMSGAYDAQDRQTSYGTLAYTYRDDGQLISGTDGQATTKYQYDAFGNLLGVTLPDGTQIDYLVDGTGRRVGKKVNGAIMRGWLYQDGLRPAAQLDGANNVVSTFVYKSPYGAPAYMMRDGNTYRIISDERGSPRLVVDTVAGTVVQRLDYDEFGQVVEDSNPGFQPFGFAGGLYDPDTALVRFGARDYIPLTGRWSGKDLLLFGGAQTNLYAYAANDPVNRIDPTGFDCLKPGVEIPIWHLPGDKEVGVNLNVNGTEFELEIGIGNAKLPIPLPTFADPDGLPFQVFQNISEKNLGPWAAIVDKVLSKLGWISAEFAGAISTIGALGPAASGFGVAFGEGAEKVVLRHHPECAKDLVCDVNPFGGHR